MLVLEHTFYKLRSAWMPLKSNVYQIPADSTEFSFEMCTTREAAFVNSRQVWHTGMPISS